MIWSCLNNSIFKAEEVGIREVEGEVADEDEVMAETISRPINLLMVDSESQTRQPLISFRNPHLRRVPNLKSKVIFCWIAH